MIKVYDKFAFALGILLVLCFLLNFILDTDINIFVAFIFLFLGISFIKDSLSKSSDEQN